MLIKVMWIMCSISWFKHVKEKVRMVAA